MPAPTEAGTLVSGAGDAGPDPGGFGGSGEFGEFGELGAEYRQFADFNLDDWPELGLQDDNPQPELKQPEPDPGSGSQLGQSARLTAWVRGRVQGVGFRWWVRRNALELGLRGFAENLVDGRVKVVAEGDREGLGELLTRLEAPGTPGYVAQVTHRWDELRGGLTGFVER